MRKNFVFVTLALIPMGLAHAQIPTAERDALIALYNATNGASWTPPTWDTATTGSECTTWKGVSCNAFDRVSKLELQYFNLDGSLPAELGDLEQLISLKLFGNPLLTGSIPPELGNLSNLQYFEAFNCALTGSIPPELGNLSKVGHIRLYNNQLTGSIPPEMGDLSMLRYLVLSGNQLTGNIPPELGKLDLRQLDVGFNQLSGSIPPELSNLTNLMDFSVDFNQLSGSIPSFLGTFSDLYFLNLRSNKFSGEIPPELGNLTNNLQELNLGSNQLSGGIPPELSALAANLLELRLEHNRLSGSIPSQLGDLTGLERLYLYGNQLSGDIPTELENLTALLNTNGLRIRWNALHTDDASLISFLDDKQYDYDWSSTQTIAPENPAFSRIGNHTIWLSWDAVSYTADPGGYEVFSSPAGSGIWTSGGWTESKSTLTFPVTGLDPGTTYDLAVVTYTDPHASNQNLVSSDFSLQVMTATADTGCTQPIIEVSGVGIGPFTLSLTESFGSYLWSTAEATSSIVAGPPYGQWYWVTVNPGGPCEETVAVLVDPEVFTDGFESGGTADWSSAVP
jgi:Leucine-rich repeat (LRR) protein